MRLLHPLVCRCPSSSLYLPSKLIKRLASTDPRSKAPFVRDKVHLNVCCLGGSGHGKTSLSSAITLLQSKTNCATYKPTEEIDKSPDERSRGQSIIPCKMEFITKSKHFVLTDLPGSQDYVKNTINGSYGSDVGIVVVNGEEGPTEQTRQHLIIARHHGIRRLIGFINQFNGSDDSENLELCELATREMLLEEGFTADGDKFISGSTIKALNNQSSDFEPIEELVSILDSFPDPERDLNSPGLFYVDKIYSPQGRGTGVTGTVVKGKFTKGQIVDCNGLNQLIKTKINYIECFNKVLDEAIHGDSVEIVLQGVKKDDLNRGMAIFPSNSYNQQNRVQVALQLFKPQSTVKAQPLINTSLCTIHFGTGEVLGQVELPKDYMVPGSSDLIEIKLLRSFVLIEGQSLIVREGNQIIGLGQVTKLLDPLTIEEQQKIMKGRKGKEKDQFKSLVDKIKSELSSD